jgi:hypothetical protein
VTNVSNDSTDTPSARQRVIIACALGIAVFVATAFSLHDNESDYRGWHLGAQLLLQGIDPYPLRESSPLWPFADPLFYPLPTLLVAAPLAWMPVELAGGTVLGLSSAGLAWLLSREGWHRLWFFASPGFVMAVEVGQWTPTICLAVLVPWLGALLVVKPNLGGPLFLWRPTWKAAAGGLLLLLVAFAIMPHWPIAWWRNLQLLESHPAPLFTWQGAWLWLAIIRWRSADARLLLISAAAPQLLFFADQLPLALLSRTRREVLATTGCGMVSWLAWYAGLQGGDLYVVRAAPFVLAGVYLPALVMVLRREASSDG